MRDCGNVCPKIMVCAIVKSINKPANQWQTHEHLNAWRCECVNPWIREHLIAWTRKCVDTWMRECMLDFDVPFVDSMSCCLKVTVCKFACSEQCLSATVKNNEPLMRKVLPLFCCLFTLIHMYLCHVCLFAQSIQTFTSVFFASKPHRKVATSTLVNIKTRCKLPPLLLLNWMVKKT